MLTITNESVHRAMSAEIPPAAVCDPGKSVRFITLDALGGQFVDDNNPIIDEDKAGNPSTGPLYVNGAEPGDMLKITVEGGGGVAGRRRPGAHPGPATGDHPRRLPV